MNCNRRSCQAPNARWWNSSTHAYYCGACADKINEYNPGLCKEKQPGNDHQLKTWPGPFDAMWRGEKTHEVRNNDRNFTKDDLLILREYDTAGSTYTGRTMFAVPTYITQGGAFGLSADLVVMSVRVIAKHANWSPE